MGTPNYLSINVYYMGTRWYVYCRIMAPGGKNPRVVQELKHYEIVTTDPDIASAAREAARVLLAEFPDESEH